VQVALGGAEQQLRLAAQVLHQPGETEQRVASPVGAASADIRAGLRAERLLEDPPVEGAVVGEEVFRRL